MGSKGGHWGSVGCKGVSWSVHHALILCPPQSKRLCLFGWKFPAIIQIKSTPHRNMCHVKLLLASRMCPTPLRGVLVVVVQNAGRNGEGIEKPSLVSQITPMQLFFFAFYHDIKKSIQFPLAFIDRFHHCAQLPTDTEIYLHSSSLDTSGIYYGLDTLKRIKCAVTHKTTRCYLH
jgi:hypothetical protein